VSNGYPIRPLGDVIALHRDQVPVQADGIYPIAGMYSFGRGVFGRDAISGAETSYRSLFRLHEGQLVMSRLNGWEGAIATVPTEYDGWFVSNEYPTFSLDSTQVAPEYLGYLCQWSGFWAALRDRARGMGSNVGARRLRVHPDELLAIEVPLPSLAEQERLANRIGVYFRREGALASRIGQAAAYPGPILQAARSALASPAALQQRGTSGMIEARLGEIADFVNGTSYDGSQVGESGLPIIRIANITNPSAGYLYTSEVFDPKFLVSPGDLLVSWSASFKSIIWPGPCGVLNQHIFHVAERDGTSRRFLRHLIEAVFNEMRQQAVGIGMMHLRREAFLGFEVVIPSPEEQRAIADRLDRIENRAGRVAQNHARSRSLLSAFRVSVLNGAFAGQL